MKKLSLISVAALMLASCSSDDLQGPAGAGTEQEVELTFQLPGDVTGRALTGSDSSKGGATNSSGDVTFTIAISYGDNVVFTGSQSTTLPNANASVTFRPTLVLGETYNLTAYAQFDGEVVELKSATTTAGLNGVTVTEAGGINDESVDAYFHQGTLVAQAQMGATLHRHTGKLRIIAEDFAAAEKQLGKTIEKVEVTYTKGQPTVFNIVNGTWDEANSLTAATASADVAEYSNESDSRTLMVDYIPAPKAEDGEIIVNISKVVVTFSDNTTFTKNLSQLDIPVKRNYLTTLRGNFFLQEMDLKIELDDTLDGELGEIDYELVSAFENGGYVSLSQDVVLDKSLVAAAGKNVVLDLNGHNITINNNSAELGEGDGIIAYGNLTINGEGTITANTRAVWARGTTGANVTINGGKYVGAALAGSNSEVIYASGDGKIVINGGEFEAVNICESGFAQPQYAILNLQGNGKTGCDITVYGGTFHKFNPADNISENPKYSFVADGYVVTEIAEETYAVKKGVTADDATSLQEALNNAAAGSVIVLSEDTNYETITVGELSDVTIVGSENSVMIFKTDANTKIENVTIKNVNFEYTGATVDCGIVVNAEAQIDNLVIEGCTFTGTGRKAGRALSGKNDNASIEFRGCTFKDLGYPIYAWGGYASLIIDQCVFENIQSWAIMPQSGFDGDLTVTGCTFKDCDGGGLIKAGTLTAGHTFTFTGNKITNCTKKGDHNWFQFNVSAGTAVISDNTFDGEPWTPTASDGLTF